MRRLLYIFFVIALAACKAGKPNDILSESKMEKILYQYHLALAAGQDGDSAHIKSRAYILACLRDNGVSEAEFDSSLVWYYQHMEELQKVYKNISDRLHAELGSMGAEPNEVDRYSTLSAIGDTANVWNGRNFYLLSGNGYDNRITFELKGDTVFKPSDQLLLNFRAQFVQREGTRHAVAALAVQYENDSVSHFERHVYGSGDISITLTAVDQPIKRVYGYIYLISEWNANPRLLFIFAPSLVRIHKLLPLPEKLAKDSLSVTKDLARDSSVADTAQIIAPSTLSPDQMHSRPTPRSRQLHK